MTGSKKRLPTKSIDSSAVFDADLILFSDENCFPVNLKTAENRFIWAIICQAIIDWAYLLERKIDHFYDVSSGGSTRGAVSTHELLHYFKYSDEFKDHTASIAKKGNVKAVRTAIRNLVFKVMPNNPKLLGFIVANGKRLFHESA